MNGAGTTQATFLFTDIEASTRAWEAHPNVMSLSLARHDELVRAAVKAAGGGVFKHTGDGVCAAFPTVSAAVGAALAAQQALNSEDWEGGHPLRVRMAVHCGLVERRQGDYFGPTLNRTARLLATAHGGQVVLSLPAAELARDSLPSGAALSDLGEHRLADLSRPERVFQLAHPGLPSAFPPLRSLGLHRQNLPVVANAFVGRERELETVADLLRGSRLVTLAGVGGVGKTRLALQVAAGLAGTQADGTYLVDLVPLADPALVAVHVGRALGLAQAPADGSGTGSGEVAVATESLCAHLARQRMLLVIDNCEHVVDAVAALCDALLRHCPDVTVLATSREPLRVPGETVWRVPSLGLPQGPEVGRVAGDAVALFCERARAADPGFVLDAANAAAVGRICERLDGIPLALELAAARLRVLGPEQLAERLDDRFRLLAGGPRTADERQRTLRATMDWSWDLLTPDERILLQRVAVFAAGFDLAAAEAVAADGTLVDEVLDVLIRLIDKSLVNVDHRAGATRYLLLETVRQYAMAKLAAEGLAEDARDRHRDHFARLADAYLATEPTGAEAPWVPVLVRENDNLRDALDWSIARGDVEHAVRFAAMVGAWWTLLGYFQEAGGRLERALALEPAAPTRLRARALNNLGFLVAQHRGDFDRAGRLHSAALAISRELGETYEAGLSGFWLGTQVLHEGDIDAARGILTAAQEDFDAVGSLGGRANCQFTLGWIAFAGGDEAAAVRHFEESCSYGRREGCDNIVAHALASLAPLAARAGEGARATALAGEAVVVARRLGWRTSLLMTCARAAEVGILLGEPRSAAAALRECLEVLRETGGRAWLADCLEMLAVVRGPTAPGAAAGLLGAGHGVREAAGETADVRPVSAAIGATAAAARDRIGTDAFAAAYERGRLLPVPEAVALGLDQLRDEPAPSEPDPPPPAPAEVAAALRRAGKGWTVGWGARSFELPDSRGLGYLARLLAAPGREVHVLDLVAPVAGANAHEGDLGPVLDDEAKAAYRRRLGQLQAEIEEARAWNDPARAERAELELDAVSRQLAAAFGLGGRARPMATTAERARTSVRKAIATAVARIAEREPDLGLLLTTTVRTGTYCSWTPDPRFPVAWTF